MNESTYQTRLKSFKNSYVNDELQKWDPQGPSMVSLARAYFEFDPIEGRKDQVSCVYCHLKLSDWAHYRGNPIQRHAELQKECFVAKLGSLCAAISKGDSVEVETIATACALTFQNRAEPLAREGFIRIALNEDEPDTLGCVQCLCYPQRYNSKVRHNRKCALSVLLQRPSARTFANKGAKSDLDKVKFDLDAKSDLDAEFDMNAKFDIEATPDLDVKFDLEAKPDLEVKFNPDAIPDLKALPKTGMSKGPSVLTMESDSKGAQLGLAVAKWQTPCSTSFEKSRDEMSEEECKCLFDRAKGAIQTELLKHAACYGSGLVTEISNLEALELAVIEHLEIAHAKRIGLICAETERVAATLIEEGIKMLESN